jgi:FAD binding domain
MNTGLHDAFDLGWKLALVGHGEAGMGLLDTYEAERRPVAERVVSSGADVEIAHAMTEPEERAKRDAKLRRIFADRTPCITAHGRRCGPGPRAGPTPAGPGAGRVTRAGTLSADDQQMVPGWRWRPNPEQWFSRNAPVTAS